MAKKETKLIWLVVGLLAIGIIAGLFLDPSVRSALQSTGDYNIQITEICAKNENILADNDVMIHFDDALIPDEELLKQKTAAQTEIHF